MYGDRSSRAVLIGIIRGITLIRNKTYDCNEDNINESWALKVESYYRWIDEVLHNTSYNEQSNI